MDFNDTTEQAQFRKTCREWLEKNAEPKSSSSRERKTPNEWGILGKSL